MWPLTPEQKAESRRAHLEAAASAMLVLKPGDRIRTSRACGPAATYTFAGWDGCWIVTASGFNDVSAWNITRINGQPVDFRPDWYVPPQ